MKTMEDKFKFKKFLATVSVFVMITSSSSYAMSTTYTSRTKNISILAGEELTLGGKIQGATLDLQGADSTLNLENGFTLDIAVTSDVAGEGIVNVLGAGNVVAGKNIGTSGTRVKDVNFFTGNNITGQTLNFGSKVYASGEITMEKYNTFKAINENVVLDAPEVKAKDASFDLGSNGKVTVDGGNLTFSGKEGRIAVTIAQSGELVSGGQIVVGNGAILKYENGSEITITPDDSNGSRPSAGKSRAFTLIQNNTGKAADGTPVVNLYSSTYPFTKWAGSFDSDGHLILTQTDKFAEEIKKILGGNLNVIDQSNTDLLASAEADTDAAKFVNEVLAKLTNNKKKLDEAIDRLTSVTTATDSIENAMKVLINVINTRLSLAGKQAVGIPVQSRAAASAKVTGVAASEEHTRYGLWFSPFFSKTTQKARKCATGYKDTTYGGSFGMDTRANDDLILGTAVTFANLEMKYKDSKSGDKIKVGSLMLSIYALQNITDTWFAQGSTTIASNKIKNSRKRVRNMTAFDVAEGKYNSMSFIGDVLFGYNYATEGVNLTPMTGARYTRVNSAGYKENGSTTGQNLNVLQKASNKFEVVVGGRLSGGTLDLNGVSVTPELHGFISHDIIGKNSKQDLRICGTPASLSAKSSKSIRTSYNLGLGVNADYGMMEYSIGYDVRLAEKRVGHKGTLKVRVNF
jgi:outer membrane autotransporter protein